MQNRPGGPATVDDVMILQLRKIITDFIDKKCGDQVSKSEKNDLVTQLVNDLKSNRARMHNFLTLDNSESNNKQEKTLTSIILVCQNPKLKNVKERLIDFLVVDEKNRKELDPAVSALLKAKLMTPTPSPKNNKGEETLDERKEIKDGLVKSLNNKKGSKKGDAEGPGNDLLQGVLVEITENGHPELAGMMIGGRFIPLAITGVSSARDIEESPDVTKEHSSPSPFKTMLTPPGSGK